MISVQIHDAKSQKTAKLNLNEGKYLISDLLKREGFHLETPCNCVGVCGKCLVKATGDLSQITDTEIHNGVIKNGYRLACTTFVEGNAQIECIQNEEELFVSDQSLQMEAVLKDEALEVHGLTQETELGLAIDVGTTGVSAQLIDLGTGQMRRHASLLNPQAAFGNDVLSRICYAKDCETGTQDLQTAILNGMEILIDKTLETNEREKLKKISISGNTTMQHLIKGVNPESIAKAPYSPAFLEMQKLSPKLLGFAEPRAVEIVLLPSASAYIGADIVSGIYAVHHQKRQNNEAFAHTLFIDIGTNGEIMTHCNGRFVATSTAAGPALEGMNISCGMRAEPGAIDKFEIEKSGKFTISTIGDHHPVGICGSGLVDIMAKLVEHNIVLKTGRFNKKMPQIFIERLKDKKFYLTETVYITQKDVRQIQLAKGAIATGIKLLFDTLKLEAKDCYEILIAGSFGYHLSAESIQTIGLIPEGFECPIRFIGNTSLKGAALSLLGNKHMQAIERLSQNIEILELSRSDAFQDVFVSSLGF